MHFCPAHFENYSNFHFDNNQQNHHTISNSSKFKMQLKTKNRDGNGILRNGKVDPEHNLNEQVTQIICEPSKDYDILRH